MSGTVKSMVISMVVLLAGCLVLYALVPRVQAVRSATVNVSSVARSVSAQQKWDVAVADGLPDGWTATNVTLRTDLSPHTWQAGYTGPDDSYAAVLQTRGGDARWVAQRTGRATRLDTISIGGVSWTRYERVDGNQRTLVRSAPLAGLATVVVGTGQWTQVEQFARTLKAFSNSSLRSVG